MISLVGSDVESLPVDLRGSSRHPSQEEIVFDPSISVIPRLMFIQISKERAGPSSVGLITSEKLRGIHAKRHVHKKNQRECNVDGVTTLLPLEPWNTCRQVSQRQGTVTQRN